MSVQVMVRLWVTQVYGRLVTSRELRFRLLMEELRLSQGLELLGWDTVSHLRSLGCVVVPSTDARNEGLGDGREDGDDFQLMYVRCFLHEAGEGVIPERVFEVNYVHLLSYLRGRLDQ